MKKIAWSAAGFILFIISTSFYSRNTNSTNYFILVDKSDYELSVYDERGWLVTYPVVFGNKDLRDKMREGDRETPEGTFTIITKRVHEKWNRLLLLDYPTHESYEKFNQRKAYGIIPPNARIGGGIAIHGTWPHDDVVVDMYQNWTLGCISLKNTDVQELYNMIPVGTKITIRK